MEDSIKYIIIGLVIICGFYFTYSFESKRQANNYQMQKLKLELLIKEDSNAAIQSTEAEE